MIPKSTVLDIGRILSNHETACESRSKRVTREGITNNQRGYMDTKDEVRGFTCECGKFTAYSLYELTNAQNPITRTCGCGVQWDLKNLEPKKREPGLLQRLFG